MELTSKFDRVVLVIDALFEYPVWSSTSLSFAIGFFDV